MKTAKQVVLDILEESPGDISLEEIERRIAAARGIAAHGATQEEVRIGKAGAILAGMSWPREDFNDWEKLSAGGAEVECGWLRDKFGVSWVANPELENESAEYEQELDSVRANLSDRV